MTMIYGQMSILPIFLLWIYLVWILVLVGVEIAYLVDNYGLLLERQRRLVTDPIHSRPKRRCLVRCRHNGAGRPSFPGRRRTDSFRRA